MGDHVDDERPRDRSDPLTPRRVAPLTGLRVLDRTTGIAGPYATKVLADAGADVVKVEPGEGDPLRRWRSGALFEYLNAGKRSVATDSDLADATDVLFTTEPVDLDGLHGVNPALVVVTVTPFGLDGPWAGRPATEFTLQASAGSTGQRGLPEQPPLAAGGRVGEWVTGTYAALAAIAAVREARRSGVGEHVDVAMLDCMAVTMTTYPSVVASFSGWPPIVGTGRTVEVPSVEPTSDGYAVFTTNSAQQFQDFVVMIGRPDLLDDPELARAATRFARREDFLRAVHDYTTKRTTAEILDDAALMRIPSGPVLNGATVTSFEQFVARSVFQPDATGRFVRPRRPYIVDGRTGAPPASPAPAVGHHQATIDWPSRSTRERLPWRLPLEGVRVIDCTAWWAGPVAPHALACLGADVIKVESIARPDLMRYAASRPATEDRWYEWGFVFHGANAGKRGVTIDLARPEGVAVFEQLAATADIVVENYTPRVMDQFGLGWDRLHAINPRLIMVRMPAFGLDGPWRERTGFAQTMECITGMAWLTGFADGPPVLVRGACDPLAGMHAVIATLLALIERDADGEGHLVESVMVEAALNVAAEQVVELSGGGDLLTRDGNRGPVAAPQGVYRCAGDDRWLALAVATDDQWTTLVDLLGRPPWATPELATATGRRAAHDRIDDELARWSAPQDADVLAERLVAAGVPAAAVITPRDMVANPQLRHRRLFEVEDHPVTGRHELPSFPVRFGHVDTWHRRPAPTLGQHNEEVLTEIGLGDDIGRLAELGIIGDRVVGT